MRRILGVFLCAGIALLLFFITRPLLDPADIPNKDRSTNTIVNRLCERSGIDHHSVDEQTTKRISRAPGNAQDIPDALRQFFADRGFDASGDKNGWMLTNRLAREDLSMLTSVLALSPLKDAELDIYLVSAVPDTYIVTSAKGQSAVMLTMRRESGVWKIDNVIPHETLDNISGMHLSNWDYIPRFEYGDPS